MLIFHSYVGLPEGSGDTSGIIKRVKLVFIGYVNDVFSIRKVIELDG